MVEYLDSVSLQNLVDQQRERQPEVLQDLRDARPARRERTPARARSVDSPATTSVAAEPVKRAPLVNSVFSLAQS
jgi:Rrf2 family iron-sulfur cluster assembly transcriptional regulator